MENNPPIKFNLGITIAIIAEAIFCIFAFVILKGLLSNDYKAAKINIDNYSIGLDFKDTSLNDESRAIIEAALNDIVALNNSGQNISNHNANIRPESNYSLYIKDLDIYFVNFIVDLSDIEQSYHIIYRYSDSYSNNSIPPNDPVMAFCLDDDEKIYEGFKCKDSYSGSAKNRVAYEMLKNKIFSNFTVGLVGNVYDNEDLSFRINTLSNDEEVVNSAINELSEYLSSIGLDLSNYEYIAASDICCSTD